jgi:EmrB/QacA subfamily drug resistance transporter
MILSVAALAFALAQTTLMPALGVLARELDTDASGVAWTITGYLIAAAVFTPIFGRLGDMFGKRRMLVVSLSAFAFGSVVSALASSIELLVAGRVLQGVGGGIFPLCYSIIRDEFPRERVATSIGLISATFGIGGGVGLVVGGILVDQASYHWIFWLGAAMAALAAVLTQLLIPESPHRSPGRVDVRGAVVLAVGLVLPLLAIARANQWGWGSATTLGLIAAGVAVLAGWVALQLRTEQPLADVRTLARPTVMMTNLTTVLIGFGMFGSFILIPQLAETPEATGYGFGLDATGAGLLMLPASLMMLGTGPLAAVIGKRLGMKVPLALGALVAAAGLLGLALGHGTYAGLMGWNIVLSIGIGLSFAAMPVLIFAAVPQSETGEATGFNTLIRSVGASLGSQVSAAILAGSVTAGAAGAALLPSDGAYTTAFLISAGIALLAAVAAIGIPSVRPAAATRRVRVGEPAHAER